MQDGRPEPAVEQQQPAVHQVDPGCPYAAATSWSSSWYPSTANIISRGVEAAIRAERSHVRDDVRGGGPPGTRASGFLDHVRRTIHAQYVVPAVGEQGRVPPRAAAQVEDAPRRRRRIRPQDVLDEAAFRRVILVRVECVVDLGVACTKRLGGVQNRSFSSRPV